jgi:hypothetical protein
MTGKPSIRAFLIHSHKDRTDVRKLYARLIRDGIEAWLDAENLQPGQDWRHAIRNAILKSDVAIVCLSETFDKQQGYRHEELKIALKKSNLLPADEVFVIPVRLEACDMPEGLAHLHRVDLFQPGGYRRLVESLRERAGISI